MTSKILEGHPETRTIENLLKRSFKRTADKLLGMYELPTEIITGHYQLKKHILRLTVEMVQDQNAEVVLCCHCNHTQKEISRLGQALNIPNLL